MAIKIPTPNTNPVPSADIENVVFAGAKIDEFATSTNHYYIDRLGVKRFTAFGLIYYYGIKFQESISNSGYVVIGRYEDGIQTLNNYNEIIEYGGEFYKIKPGVNPPFTTTGTTADTWAQDVNSLASVGDATLRSELSASDGYTKIGGFYSQEGAPTTEPNSGLSLDARRDARGQFDIVSPPWESDSAVGMTFGGDNAKGTITINTRGMIKTSLWYKGKRIVREVALPILQSLGYKSGPDSFQGVMLRMGNPDLTPTLFVDYDSSGLPVLGVMNPQQFGEYGYPNPNDEGLAYNIYPTRKQVQSSINSALTSFNPYFTYSLPSNDQSANVWVPVATFTTATGTGNANGVFKALIQVSGNVFYNNRTYLISGNSRGLSSVTLSSSNVNSYFNITALDAPLSDDANNVNYIVSAGVTQSGNTVTLYLKMPYSCAYATIQALVVGFSSYVKYNPSSFTSNSNAPSGIIYLTTVKPYNSANVTVKSDGTLVAASPIVRVSTSENFSDRPDINSGDFEWSGSGCVNTLAASVSVVRNGTGDYIVKDAHLATEGWQVHAPKGVNGGEDLCIVVAENSGEDVSIKVYERNLVISDNKLSIEQGNPMDVPSESWIDVRLYESPMINLEQGS